MRSAASPVVVLGHEGLIAVTLSKAFTGAVMHGFEANEGFYSVGLEDWPGAFVEGAGDVSCLVAPAAGEIGVAKIQLEDGLSALADECKTEVTEASSNWFESECLGAASMGEFDRIAGQADAGQIWIPKADVGGGVGPLVAGDVQVVDVDLRQFLSNGARVAAMRIALGQ
jgi:hypothetical protein